MTGVAPSIASFYEAVARGDRAAAAAAVATDFGIHDGKSREAWIDHELHEFAHRKGAVGFASLRLTDIASPGITGARPFAVMTESEDLLFEEALKLDRDGRIIGNGRQFEIVTKLLFTQGSETRRAMAIRSSGAEVAVAMPDAPGTRDILLSPGMNFDNDRFTTLSFAIDDDDLAGKLSRVYLRGIEARGVWETVYMRGIDSPRFGYLAAPVIDGNLVDLSPLAGGLPLWSMTAELIDGSFVCIEHPPFAVLTCRTRVRTVVITDALDNDWSWSAGA